MKCKGCGVTLRREGKFCNEKCNTAFTSQKANLKVSKKRRERIWETIDQQKDFYQHRMGLWLPTD